MSPDEEARTVYRNLRGDHWRIAEYVVNRCGDFTFDSERTRFIGAFLMASSHHVAPPENEKPAGDPPVRIQGEIRRGAEQSRIASTRAVREPDATAGKE